MIKTIAITWELGGGLGHLSTFLPLITALQKENYRIVFIVRDVSRIELLFPESHLEFLQAPVWSPRLSKQPGELNFVETLFHLGYLKPNGLIGLVKAWKNLFDIIRPDLLIADHSPTALLAARSLNIPKILFGNSFTVLPSVSPTPEYRFLEHQRSKDSIDRSKARLVKSEKLIIENCNKAMKAIGAPPIKNFYEIYQVSHSFLTTDKQLDVYQRESKANTEFIGVIQSKSIGTDHVHWPYGSTAPKGFIYLKQEYRFLEAVLSACQSSEAQFLIYIDRLSHTLMQRYSSKKMTFSDKPYQIDTIRNQCDFAILHGGNLLEAFLEVGKPLLMLPMQMEQTMSDYRVKAAKAGVVFTQEDSPDDLILYVEQLINERSYRDAAKVLSRNMGKIEATERIKRVVDKVDALLIQ
ncbi:hypothetical protein ACVBE9_01435 [Eionea flava]